VSRPKSKSKSRAEHARKARAPVLLGNPRRLIDEAYERLKFEIVTLQLAPGEKISEAVLAARFELGTTPIRSAVARLALEGLIVALSERTNVVAPLTLTQIQEVFALRKLLEPHAARLAAGRIDPRELHALEEACQVGYTAGNIDEEYAFLVANRKFHVAIARASGSERLAAMVEQLEDAAMRILCLVLEIENHSEDWQHGHRDILEALVTGNGTRAAEIALAQLVESEELVTRVVLKSSMLSKINLAPAAGAR
jgi:DNA-binding GntR family transcriptional regulator